MPMTSLPWVARPPAPVVAAGPRLGVVGTRLAHWQGLAEAARATKTACEGGRAWSAARRACLQCSSPAVSVSADQTLAGPWDQVHTQARVLVQA